MFFSLKVLHTAVDVTLHLYGVLKFFEHELYLHHSGYHYAKLLQDIYFDLIFGKFGCTAWGG